VPVRYGQLKIVPVPVALDNYAYLIVDDSDGTSVLVDPSDPDVVQVVLCTLSHARGLFPFEYTASCCFLQQRSSEAAHYRTPFPVVVDRLLCKRWR